ncbi:hypothetical protein QP240_11580, partial [Lactobacillus crispatus]|nr:hypothetical protein [Lactobacillus crispatus]
SGEHSFQQDKVEIPNKELTDFHSFQVSLFLEFVNHIFSHFSIFVNQTNAKTRRSGFLRYLRINDYSLSEPPRPAFSSSARLADASSAV